MRNRSGYLLLRSAALLALLFGFSTTSFSQAPGLYAIGPNVSLGYLNLRTGPNTTYPIVAAIPAGTGGIKITECGKKENPSQAAWCKAEWGSYSGWISSCCIVPSNQTANQGGGDPRWEPYRRSLRAFYVCLEGHSERAAEVSMPPTDFSRMVQGTCIEAVQAVRTASVAVAKTYGLDYSTGSSTADKSVRDARTEVISRYTEKYYRSDANKSPSAGDKKPQSKVVSSGSGFIVSKQGHLLTNAHVVEGCTALRVRISDQSNILGLLVAVDKKDDLALIKLPGNFPRIGQLRLSKPVRAGENIVVYGFPLQQLLSSSGNVSTGIVTAQSGFQNDTHQLQISAPVQGGNSGGPLLDGAGNVVGVIVAKLSYKAANVLGEIPQNVNFAIKAPIVAAFLDSHNISYSTEVSEAALSVPDITDRAKEFTAAIECESNSPVR